MGRYIYVPKPPKKRGDSVPKGKIIARALLRHLHPGKDPISVASNQISSRTNRFDRPRLIFSKMGPRDLTERHGNAHSNRRSKSKSKITRNSSSASFQDLTQEGVDVGMNAVRSISKILHFMQGYKGEIEDVESIYGVGIRQQARIEELDSIVTDLTFRKDQETARLYDENESYKADVHRLDLDREELEREKASMNDTRMAMQSDMQRQKEDEINEAKKQLSDKATAKIKWIKEELEKKVKTLEAENNALKDDIKTLKEKNKQAQKDFDEQKDSFQIDIRSFQSYIRSVESELLRMKALSTVSPQKPQFYISGFQKLFESIQDVAQNDFLFVPENTESLDSGAVRNQLCKASGIFRYPLLSSESTVSAFLRQCAIQNFISSKAVSIIQRRYFAESTPVAGPQSGPEIMDFILDAISNVPSANPGQELSWRLNTIDKLDRLDSRSQPEVPNISTKPDVNGILHAILHELRYLECPSEHGLSTKLAAIAQQAIKLWGALRKDSCRINLDYEPSTNDGKKWNFVRYEPTHDPTTTSSLGENHMTKLPLKSFVLFPRITGLFDSDSASPQVLHNGLALSHDSPAFQEGLLEIERINHATKEFERGLRRRAGTQSSPIMDNHQGEGPTPHGGFK